MRVGDCVDAAFFPQINEFRQKRSVQLLLSDLRIHDGAAAEAILRGEIPAHAAAPAREEFAALWRALSGHGGAFSAPSGRFCALLCPALTEETLCLCLKVFEELGLVRIALDGGNIAVACVPDAPRAELGNSRLLAALEHPAE